MTGIPPGSTGHDAPLADAGASKAGSAKLGLCLTLLLAIPVAAFFAFAAFSPASLAVPINAGRPTTAWFVYGLALIGLSITFGGIYVLAANRAAARAAMVALLFACAPAHAATAGSAEPAGPNLSAVSLFVLLVLLTLAITYWAARRTRSAKDFYAAGGNLTALQNGLAIAGDVISAGAFLGLAGLVYDSGFDGLVYAAGYAVAYPVISLRANA